MMSQSMTGLMIMGDKYALHVFRLYRQTITTEEIQFIDIYQTKNDA